MKIAVSEGRNRLKILFLSANEKLQEKQSLLKKENASLLRRIEAQEISLQESERELRKAIEMATASGKVRIFRSYLSKSCSVLRDLF